MTYDGPERRKAEKKDAFDKLGAWMIGRQSTFAVIVIVQLLLLGFVALGVALLARSSSDEVHQLEEQVEISNQSAADARIVADFVRVCIIGPVADRTTARCGSQDGGSAVVKSLVTYMNCAFLILPAERTEVNLTACALKGFGQ